MMISSRHVMRLRCGCATFWRSSILKLTYGSLFSGIEGFGLGFEQAGFEIRWQVEKDKFCRKVLTHHWPKVKRYSDVKRVGIKQLEEVSVITAGVPCQDVSIAGKRAGLAGSRTSLVYHFARILQELRPRWFVFENVPGLFSSNEGRDFAEILRILMVECGYGVSWRVLDSRYFNVAQRRSRVFIVGRLGEPCPAQILFESESCSGDFAARGEAWQDIAVPLTSGSGISGHKPGRRQEDDFNIVQQAISAKWAKGTSGPSGNEHHNLVAGRSYPRGDGSDNLVCFDTTQLTNRDNRSNPQPGDPCHPLSASAHAPAIAGTVNHLDHQHGTDEAANGLLAICSPPDAHGVRDFARLPQGLDSARYRALGNAVTATVSYWIAKRIAQYEKELEHG